MNKTDYEVLLQYVEETDKEFYESLSTQKFAINMELNLLKNTYLSIDFSKSAIN
jgi:hypothetical protein